MWGANRSVLGMEMVERLITGANVLEEDNDDNREQDRNTRM